MGKVDHEFHQNKHESFIARELADAKSFNPPRKTNISEIMRCSLLATVVTAAVVVASSIGVNCKLAAVGVDSASVSVTLSDVDLEAGGAYDVDFVLSLMPGGEEVQKGTLTKANTVLSFSELKSYRTYRLVFTAEQEGETSIVDSFVFTTQKPAPPKGNSGGATPGNDDGNTVDDPIPEPEKEVEVPDLLGKTYDEAEKILKEIGLVAVQTSDYSDTYAKGLVCAQLYSGKKVPLNTEIQLTVSLGKYVSVGVQAAGLSLTCYPVDCCVGYNVRWRQNDAANASMRVTVNGKNVKSYNAAQTVARLVNGVYVFSEDFVNLPSGDDETPLIVPGTTYTFTFTLSYELDGATVKATQKKSVKYGGASISGFAMSSGVIFDGTITYNMSFTVHLNKDSTGKTQYDDRDDRLYVSLTGLAGEYAYSSILMSDSSVVYDPVAGTITVTNASVEFNDVVYGTFTAEILVPCVYMFNDGQTIDWQYRYTKRILTELGG